jgi:glyoxylase-like metal-dependent hydrolase (beta-lactamase superfamily II)
MNVVTVLEINLNHMMDSIYPVIISDDQEMVLIDCGYPGFLPMLKDAAKKQGLELERLTKVIITHHDFDHMGSLAQIKKEYPSVTILSSRGEADYITGKHKSLRLQQAEELYEHLPEEEKEGGRGFQKMLEAVEPSEVEDYLQDGQVLNICGGIEIIATPGHMPGHISIYHRQSKTLITGDAMVVEKEQLMIANPKYTLDMEEAKASIHKLTSYDIDRVICYHGGVITDNIVEAMKQVIQN